MTDYRRRRIARICKTARANVAEFENATQKVTFTALLQTEMAYLLAMAQRNQALKLLKGKK